MVWFSLHYLSVVFQCFVESCKVLQGNVHAATLLVSGMLFDNDDYSPNHHLGAPDIQIIGCQDNFSNLRKIIIHFLLFVLYYHFLNSMSFAANDTSLKPGNSKDLFFPTQSNRLKKENKNILFDTLGCRCHHMTPTMRPFHTPTV